MVHGRYFTLFLALLVAITAPLQADTPEAQDSNWCGNKHKNLVRLSQIVQGVPGVEVPIFIGIPSARVETFLRKEDPSIFKHYQDVVHELVHKTPIPVDSYSYPQTIEQRIDLIQSKIKNAFKKMNYNYGWWKRSNPNTPLFSFTADETKLFEETNKQNLYFMVRSTGVEDSQTIANAGGNASIAYVYPTALQISYAMGEVVASYFGMQSLKNRIAGGETLSATNLCLPVLIQVLVGEPLEGAQDITEIPVSGVAFTTNQSISGTNFPITEINASYGHGEGVVANRVTADRYYVASARSQAGTPIIYPMLFYKAERLVPHIENSSWGNTKPTLISFKNTSELAQKSALSQSQIRSLYTVLKKIETAYGQPMDVEFVVRDQTIYIVQARPAMRSAATPSYVVLEKLTTEDTGSLINGITLVPGNAKALIITNPADIIVAKTLDEADQMPNSGTCKAVIVGEWASSLSHAAVNFISHGIPCLYIQNLPDIKKILSKISATTPLIIDAQRRVCFLWNPTGKNIADFITQGWFEHPLDATLSLFLESSSIVAQPTKLIPLDHKIAQLLEKLKKATIAQERKTIATDIAERINKRLSLTEARMRSADALCDAAFKKAFTTFKARVEELLKEFMASVDANADHFEILFYHKMLQAILYQSADSQRGLATYNYSYFLNELLANQVLMAIKRKVGNTAFNKEFMYANHCPNPALAQQWRTFLTSLELYAKSPNATSYAAEAQQLKDMLARFDTMKYLPIWFATEFYQAMKEQPLDTLSTAQQQIAARALITTLTKSYTMQINKFLMHIEACKDAIQTFAHQPTLFTRRSVAEELWKQLQTSVIQPLTDNSLITMFNPSTQSPLALKMIACDCMRACIDTMDAFIKTVKVSNDLSESDRHDLIRMMLDDFNHTFRWWITNLMPEKALQYNGSWPLKDYLQTMQEIYDYLVHDIALPRNSSAQGAFRNTSQQQRLFVLQRSEHFAVNAAMLGSSTAFERHYPYTVEDIFMLIHQNSLVTVAALYASLFDDKPLQEILYLPPLVQESMAYLASKNAAYIFAQANNIQSPKRIGISYTANSFELLYNMALNNHSSTCQIKYDTATQQCTFAVQFLGEARSRWEQVALLAFLSPHLSSLELASNVVLDTKAGITSWSWYIKKADDLPLICKYFMKGAWLSFVSNLNLNFLSDVHTTSNSLYTMLPPLLKQYEETYGTGSSSMIQHLLHECNGINNLY